MTSKLEELTKEMLDSRPDMAFALLQEQWTPSEDLVTRLMKIVKKGRGREDANEDDCIGALKILMMPAFLEHLGTDEMNTIVERCCWTREGPALLLKSKVLPSSMASLRAGIRSLPAQGKAEGKMLSDLIVRFVLATLTSSPEPQRAVEEVKRLLRMMISEEPYWARRVVMMLSKEHQNVHLEPVFVHLLSQDVHSSIHAAAEAYLQALYAPRDALPTIMHSSVPTFKRRPPQKQARSAL